MEYLFAFFGSYALGSIPFGYIVASIKGYNIREKGSGNIGATNIFRVIGKKEGIFVFIMDVLKGFLPVYFFLKSYSPVVAIVAVLGAALGHITTPFLKFKGGKGIATGFGGFLALMPVPSLCTLGLWGVLVLVTRRVSIGSLGGALGLPLFYYFLTDEPVTPVLILSILLTVVVFVTHRSNIKRILRGKEEPVF